MDNLISALPGQSAEHQVAGANRRWRALDCVLRDLRIELLAGRMMEATLQSLAEAAGAAGALVIYPHGETPGAGRQVGPEREGIAAAAVLAFQDEPVGAVHAKTAAGENLIVCRVATRFSACPGLVLWRAAGAPDWDHDDLALLGVATSIIRIVIEHEAIQKEMAIQARTDPLTGLPNRRAFLDEARRRIERTNRENTPATLMLIDIDRFRQINEKLGHDVGDNALLATTDLLRQTFRPTDLIARTGGDKFAVWLDGADAFSSAERADSLCQLVAGELDYAWDSVDAAGGGTLRISIGIAMRWPGGEEDVDALISQAGQALSAVKAAGGGHWQTFKAQ